MASPLSGIGCSVTGSELRITHVIRAKPPGELGGADIHVLDLATAQHRQGHRVRVVCLGPAEITSLLRYRGIPHLQVDSTSMLRWSVTLGLLLRIEPPDVLHSHGYRADIICALVGAPDRRRYHRIAAMTVHGFLRTTAGLRLLTRVNQYALRRADIIISVSVRESQRLSESLRRPIEFVPNGVSAPDLSARAQAAAILGVDPSSRTVAFVGRLSPEKRPDLFIHMATIVAREHPGVEFIIIGSGALRHDLEKRRAAVTGVRLRFAGLLHGIASLMTAIDVLVCPSDAEGTPRVVIEAMLAGVPVVATRVGGVPDLIVDQQTGFLVQPGSALALATVVSQLLADPALATATAIRARNHAREHFSADQMAQRVELTYRSALIGRVLPLAPVTRHDVDTDAPNWLHL
jgi:glycosyltransferase involved in cell wall biosynthesis